MENKLCDACKKWWIDRVINERDIGPSEHCHHEEQNGCTFCTSTHRDVTTWSDETGTFEIKYCPACGRKL